MRKVKSNFLKLRVYLLHLVSQILLGKLSGKVPATVINSIEEQVHHPVVRGHVEEIITIADATVEKYAFPHNYLSSFRRQKAFDKKNLYLLNNVCVSPFSGLTWIKDSFFLVESIGSLFRMIGWHNLLHEPLLKREQLEEEEYVISCPNHPYYHWIFESLPGILIALETMPSAKVLIADNCPTYCKEVLKLIFGKQKYAKRVIMADGVRVVPKFFTLQQEPDAGFVHPVAIQYLKSFSHRLLLNVDPDLAGANVYISRKKASKRKLYNEEEVEEALQELGFKVIYSEDLSVAEQIALFSQVKCIVAPHGAGLSNMVWAKQKVKVLEIFAHGYFNDCFARLAMALGFNYYHTFAQQQNNTSGKVNVTELVGMVRSMLQVKEPFVANHITREYQLVPLYQPNRYLRVSGRSF